MNRRRHAYLRVEIAPWVQAFRESDDQLYIALICLFVARDSALHAGAERVEAAERALDDVREGRVQGGEALRVVQEATKAWDEVLIAAGCATGRR